MIFLRQYWIISLGNISTFSLGSVALIYFLSEWSLTRTNMESLDSIILSILFTNVFLQSYELIYHFSFPIYLNYFKPPSLNGDEIRYVLVELLAICPILLIRTHLSFKILSIVLLTFFITIWIVWILYGFPQYFFEGYFYLTILKTGDPYTLALILNFGSKFILAMFFISLLDFGSAFLLCAKKKFHTLFKLANLTCTED